MCKEARRLFNEYCSALEGTESGASGADGRVRTAMGRFSNHNRNHRCCATLRFEAQTGRPWTFRLKTPAA